MDMTLALYVGCPGISQCVPFQASTLTLTLTPMLGVVKPLYRNEDEA